MKNVHMHSPSLFWLFGEVGCGKSYIARIISDQFHFHLYEADEDLTPEMVEAIARKETFSQEMRDDYYALVAGKLATLRRKHPRVVISQALYRQKNRVELLQQFPTMRFIWVIARRELIEARLLKRADWVDPELARKKSSQFEPPPIGFCPSIDNNESGPDHILRQWQVIVAQPAS